MEKRLFQILDEMNQEDIKYNTGLVAVSSNFVSGKTIKQGAVVEMGIPADVLPKIMNNEVMIAFITIDAKEYNKRKNGLTRAQAQVAFANGKMVTHKLFLDGEYIVLSKGKMIDESGLVLDKQDFWLVRTGNPSFDTGWFIID